MLYFDRMRAEWNDEIFTQFTVSEIPQIVEHLNLEKVKVSKNTTPQERNRFSAGVAQIRTPISALDDKDTQWGPDILLHKLCCFPDPEVEAVWPPVLVHPARVHTPLGR